MTSFVGNSEARPNRTSKTQSLFRYAVVDLANADRVREKAMRQFPTVAAPLLDRKLPYRLLSHGPWVFRISHNPHTREIREDELTDDHWGYFISTSIDVDSLRQTLRRFNLVRLEGRENPVLFRYWDPRVMQMFLRTSKKHQRRSLFEFIDAIEFANGEVYSRSKVYS